MMMKHTKLAVTALLLVGIAHTTVAMADFDPQKTAHWKSQLTQYVITSANLYQQMHTATTIEQKESFQKQRSNNDHNMVQTAMKMVGHSTLTPGAYTHFNEDMLSCTEKMSPEQASTCMDEFWKEHPTK